MLYNKIKIKIKKRIITLLAGGKERQSMVTKNWNFFLESPKLMCSIKWDKIIEIN